MVCWVGRVMMMGAVEGKGGFERNVVASGFLKEWNCWWDM